LFTSLLLASGKAGRNCSNETEKTSVTRGQVKVFVKRKYTTLKKPHFCDIMVLQAPQYFEPFGWVTGGTSVQSAATIYRQSRSGRIVGLT